MNGSLGTSSKALHSSLLGIGVSVSVYDSDTRVARHKTLQRKICGQGDKLLVLNNIILQERKQSEEAIVFFLFFHSMLVSTAV